MRVFHIFGDQFAELDALPEALPASGYLWVASARREFEVGVADVQAALQRWTGSQLFELHVSDLINDQLPSHFDYTSEYDMLVFRRLAAGAGSERLFADEEKGTPATARAALQAIDTSPVGFAVFDRVLLSVHPTDCMVRDYFAERLKSQVAGGEGRAAARMPTGPADLMLRMVNYMVDSYLELRRLLSRQIDYLQHQLVNPQPRSSNLHTLLDSRNSLRLLEDTCEDQRAAIVEWIDALEEWPAVTEPKLQREREQLRLRSRDVLEHIERVLTHVRRLESAAETAVQMHFSEQNNRTNDIMRALTVLTAIFLPLNFLTGFFGMNFEGLPLIHSPTGFWIVFAIMFGLGVGMSVFFWRKRYLGRT
ncbi:MAG: magnesium transporter CorA family protein [Caldimonas sp.]